MKNRSRLLTVLLYIVVFAVAVVLISEVFFRDDTVYVNYSTVCEQFRSENVRSFDYDNGVLTLELRKPYQNEAYSVSHKLADLGLFYEDLGTLIAEQQESGILQSYNYVPTRQTPWYVRMLPEMLLSVIMIALVYMVLMRNSGGMMKFGHANARVGSGRDKVMFSDVAGADEEKAELQEIVDFLRDPAKYRRIGARIPKGVLLVGPPGTGKTLLARAVASARAAFATCLSRPSAVPLPLFSSMRSTPSAAAAVPVWAEATTSGSRRSTSSLWRWTASAAMTASSLWRRRTAAISSTPPFCARAALTARSM